MANFAVAASAETIERGKRLLDMYSRDNEKQEDTLARIFDIAESEQVRGTHPELEETLRDTDSTIATLIKQINGIVAGQDKQIEEYKERLNKAIEDKNKALEASKADKEAMTIIEAQARKEIEKANGERDQALRERDDARIIANEKTASNELLLGQMASMKESVENYKQLQKVQAELQRQIVDLNQQIARNAAETELAIEKAVIAKEREMQAELRAADKENAILLARIEQLEKSVQ